jgi:carbon monoxide dehydrogenase subunit G
MQLEHSFTVPVGVDDAWTVLLDIERIAPCMPGAAIDSVDGDDFTGSVKVKLGPIGITYKGKASFVEKDTTSHRAVIDARGRDSRGNGTANAKITATLTADGPATTVHVVTDLDITGKAAQFGRGVMVDVGNKLIGQFADCLAGKLASGADAPVGDAPVADAPVADSAVAEPSAAAEPSATASAASRGAIDDEAITPASNAVPETATPDAGPATVEPINLVESAGPAIVKRLAPVVAVLAVVAFAVFRRRAAKG